MTKKIFVVEDNDDTRDLLALLLEGAGHQVRTASTVQQALHEIPLSGSEVLICDIGLPDGSGSGLIEHLRLSGRLPYAIAMSGLGATVDVAASRAAGFRHHIVKPIDFDELERLVAAADTELGRKS